MFQLQSVGYMDAVMYLGIGLSNSPFLAGYWAIIMFSMIYFILIATEFFTPIREAGYGMHLVMMNTKMADRILILDSVQKLKVETKQRFSTISALEWAGFVLLLWGQKILDRSLLT